MGLEAWELSASERGVRTGKGLFQGHVHGNGPEKLEHRGSSIRIYQEFENELKIGFWCIDPNYPKYF